MKKIRIAHISPDSVIYGTERHILSIVKYSDKNIFEHCVITPTEGVLNHELNKFNINTIITGRKPGYKSITQNLISREVLNMYKIFKKEKFDIVHTHLNTYGGFVSKLSGTAINIHTRHGIFWSEDEINKISFVNRKYQKLKSAFFDMTVAIGDYEKKALMNYFGYSERKISKTVNGVNVQGINSSTDLRNTKEKLFGTENIIIGTTGRMERQKGMHYFIEAVNLIKDNCGKMKFVIIGNGSQYNELSDLIIKYGLDDKFILMDYKTNIYDYVRQFDIYVQTSLWEGMSYAVQEAMALGKPVISLTSENVSGVKELIEHGVTGYLIKENFTENLAKYILELATDNSKIKEMGNSGRERELNCFPEWRTAKDMDNLYYNLFINKPNKIAS